MARFSIPLLLAAAMLPLPAQGWQGGRGQLMWTLTEDDVLLPITSLEWGRPDRVSFTSRYLHLFTQDRDRKPWVHAATATLSPGTDGGRLGVGYKGVWKGPSRSLPLMPEARVVLLRTWGHPLQTAPGRTFLGGELRLGLTFLGNAGVGWYRSTSETGGRRESFWALHVGVGL